MRLLPLLALAGLAAFLLSRRRLDPDERIRRSVRRLLPDNVQMTVDDGVVSLRGALSRGPRDDLLVAVLAIPGVIEVRNLLVMQDESDVTEQGAAPRGMGHRR